jgi:hypothetical protein
MKKIKTTDITTTAAMPVKQGTLDHLQSAYTEIVQGFSLQMLSQAPRGIIYGCILTQVGSNWSITSGYIYSNGEIYLADATSGVLSGGQSIFGTITTTNLTAANADPVEFSNGSSYNVHEIRKIVWSSGTSGTDTYTNYNNNRFGRWFAYTYSSSYLTANVGTWTIASSADWNVKFNSIGRTITLAIDINNFKLSGTANTLYLQTLFTASKDITAVGFASDDINTKIVSIKAATGSNILEIKVLSGISSTNANFATGPTFMGKLYGQITFETEAYI